MRPCAENRLVEIAMPETHIDRGALHNNNPRYESALASNQLIKGDVNIDNRQIINGKEADALTHRERLGQNSEDWISKGRRRMRARAERD
jgi:hypothetical protein